MVKNKLKNRKISGIGKERRKYLNKSYTELFTTVSITSLAKLTVKNKSLFRRARSSHWEFYCGRGGRGRELHRIYSSLTSTALLVLFLDPQHQVFWQDTFGRTPQSGHTSKEPSLQCWQAVIWYFGVLSCTSFPDTETQTTNGMIGISVYLSIFYYSCHFRGLQIINSPYLFICFPSKIFPFHLKPLFVVQAAAHLIRPNRATEQLWRGLKNI